MTNWKAQVLMRRPCAEAVAWVDGLGDVDAAVAWRACRRGDWMLWWIREIGRDGRRAAALIVMDLMGGMEEARPLVEAGKLDEARDVLSRAGRSGLLFFDQAIAGSPWLAVYDAAEALANPDVGEFLAKAADGVRAHFPEPVLP